MAGLPTDDVRKLANRSCQDIMGNNCRVAEFSATFIRLSRVRRQRKFNGVLFELILNFRILAYSPH